MMVSLSGKDRLSPSPSAVMNSFLTGYKTGQAKKVAAEGKVEKALPWVDKYRPKKVDEIVFQDEVVKVLKKCLDGSDIPNFLFYGPPGTGKTSAAIAIARELFGHEMYKDRVLELNASDERGIQVIREKVKKFAQYSAAANRPDGKPCPALKLIILDEADSMTSPAQAALRRTMEKESKTTRFFIICNYISRIIDPIASRTAKFRFKPLSQESVFEKLRSICVAESVKCSDEALKLLIDSCEGDLRKAITSLQSAARYYGGEDIGVDEVQEVAGVIPQSWIDRLMATAETKKFEQMQTYIEDLEAEGYPASQLFSQILDVVLAHPLLTDRSKANICEKLAVCDHRLLEGANEYLQLMDFGCALIQEFKLCT